jgi:sec-independent protein translocase protein TatA
MDIGAPELIIILVVVLLIFGPGRIVKLARELGSGIRQFREGLETPPESDKDEEQEEAPSDK